MKNVLVYMTMSQNQPINNVTRDPSHISREHTWAAAVTQMVSWII